MPRSGMTIGRETACDRRHPPGQNGTTEDGVTELRRKLPQYQEMVLYIPDRSSPYRCQGQWIDSSFKREKM
jgi:hypothetical protein